MRWSDADAAEDGEAADEARRLLPTLLTPELASESPETFMKLFEKMEPLCGRERTQALILELLPSLREYYPAAGVFIRDLNLWNGVDIGGIGATTDTEATTPDGARSWRRVVRDAVEWGRTGIAPADRLASRRARDGDLRVVVMPGETPKAAAVCLCRPPRANEPVSLSDIAGGGDMIIACETRNVRGPHTAFDVRITLCYSDGRGGFNRATLGVAYGALPVTSLVYGVTVTVEDATSPESVLKGTKVLEGWWRRHGPEGVALPEAVEEPTSANAESTAARVMRGYSVFGSSVTTMEKLLGVSRCGSRWMASWS